MRVAAEREYLLEYQQIGACVKVSALDPETGVEVSITGPASAGEAVLRATAIRKLQYVLGRGEKPLPPAGSGRGIVA